MLNYGEFDIFVDVITAFVSDLRLHYHYYDYIIHRIQIKQ